MISCTFENGNKNNLRHVVVDNLLVKGNIILLIVIDLPFRSPDEERQNVSFVFFCEAKEKKGNPDWESTEQKWFELDNLPKKEEFAFDHYKMIEIYLDYKKNNRSLPIFQSPI